MYMELGPSAQKFEHMAPMALRPSWRIVHVSDAYLTNNAGVLGRGSNPDLAQEVKALATNLPKLVF